MLRKQLSFILDWKSNGVIIYYYTKIESPHCSVKHTTGNASLIKVE